MNKELRKKRTKILTTAVFMLFVPIIIFAAEKKLVPCDGTKASPCNLNYLVQLAQNIIEFIIKVSPFVAAVAFAYAGFKYVTAAGNTGQIAEAHKIFSSVAIGFIIILSAWLVVKAVLVGLGAEPWAIRLGR